MIMFQPLYFKIHLLFHIIDAYRNTHTTISFYTVLLHKSLTDKMRRTEFYHLILLNRSCFPHFVVHTFPNAIMDGHSWVTAVSVAKKQEYCVKRVNKANSSPSKALFCYFYHCFACIIHASMNFSTPVR